MDKLGQATLKAEVAADCEVLANAVAVARERLGQGSAPQLEACAFHLVRAYNAIEQMGLRIAKAFENHIDDERGWHTELIHRLCLAITGVRPRFFPRELTPDLMELRGFRHLIVHAYDVNLRKDRTVGVLEAAERIANRLPTLIETFFAQLSTDEAGPYPRPSP